MAATSQTPGRSQDPKAIAYAAANPQSQGVDCVHNIANKEHSHMAAPLSGTWAMAKPTACHHPQDTMEGGDEVSGAHIRVIGRTKDTPILHRHIAVVLSSCFPKEMASGDLQP